MFLGLADGSYIDYSPIEAVRAETPFQRAVIDCLLLPVVFIRLDFVWPWSMNLELDVIDCLFSLIGESLFGVMSSLMFISGLLSSTSWGPLFTLSSFDYSSMIIIK